MNHIIIMARSGGILIKIDIFFTELLFNFIMNYIVNMIGL